jgi:TPR repeat protein
MKKLIIIALLFSAALFGIYKSLSKLKQGPGTSAEIAEKIDPSEDGNKETLYNMALIFHKGEDGVEQDYKNAMEYYKKAAAQGDASSMINLGVMYEKGQGVQQDYKQAMEWYLKAADKDNGLARSREGLQGSFRVV